MIKGLLCHRGSINQIAHSVSISRYVVVRYLGMSAFNLAKRKEPSGRNVSPPPVKRRIQSTTTSECLYAAYNFAVDEEKLEDKVASFFKPLSEKPTETTTWNVVESSLLVAHHEPFPELIQERRQSKRRRIAAFDLVSLTNPFSCEKLIMCRTER